MSPDGANPFAPAEAMARLWFDMASRMVAATTSVSPEAAPPDAARELRNAVLRAWGETFDQFLRSPEFLHFMRQSVANAVQVRQAANEALGQWRHDLQGVSRQDADYIVQLLRRLDQRLDELDARLGRVEAGLERLEQRGGKKGKKRSAGKPPAGNDGGA